MNATSSITSRCGKVSVTVERNLNLFLRSAGQALGKSSERDKQDPSERVGHSTQINQANSYWHQCFTSMEMGWRNFSRMVRKNSQGMWHFSWGLTTRTPVVLSQHPLNKGRTRSQERDGCRGRNTYWYLLMNRIVFLKEKVHIPSSQFLLQTPRKLSL